MNGDLATMCATRPADGLRMRTNQVLNDLDAELAAARVEFPVRTRRAQADLEQHAIAAVKSELRLVEMTVAVERAAARLVKIGVL